MLKFLKKISLILLPVFAMAGFNLCVDPQMLFNKGPLYVVTQELEAEQTAECYSDFDEREFKRLLLQSERFTQVDVLVLGSSRAMTINEDAFSGQKVLNLAVSGATLEDLLALWHLAESHVKYKTLLLVLDPWILNPEHGDIRWKTLVPQYQEALAALNSPPASVSGKTLWQTKVREIFSPLYFMDSVDALSKERKSLLGVRRDGSIIYRTPPPEYKESEGPIYKLSPFPQIDKFYRANLERWLSSLKKSDHKVVLWFAPFRPDTYRRLSAEPDYRNFRETEAYFKELSQEMDFKTFGSYDPSQESLTAADFWDGIHLLPSKVKEYLQRDESALVLESHE